MAEIAEKELTKETVSEVIEQLKRDGKLGNEIIIRIDKVIGQSENSALYLCQVLKPENIHTEMINPWTNKSWTVGFFKERDKYFEGDVLVGRYSLHSKKKNLDQLIRPIPSTLKPLKLPRPKELIERHGEDFVQFLQQEFSGEETLLGLMYERWMETADNDVEQHETKKNDLQKQIQKLTKNVSEKETALRNIEMETEIKNQAKAEIEQQILEIRTLFSFSKDKAGEEILEDFYTLEDGEDFFQVAQRGLYHINGENLVYEYDIVKRFITALRTDQLVLLTGPSGTGKSSLVHQIGEVLHPCIVHHIAVQSNWTDVQDLLGFFNPLKNTYLPTPFLQALVDARNDQNSLHIICLDEMNLAHVEFYFSSLLSAREKQPEKRFLDLYAYKFYRETILDLEEMLGKPLADISASDIEKLDIAKRREARNKYELIFDYPAQFPIPTNVRFVGTLNMDETVKPLSPKVIDRSFIIELDHPSKLTVLREQLTAQSISRKMMINVADFILPALEEPTLTDEQVSVIEEVLDLSTDLKEIPNAVMNSRGIKHMERYISALPTLDGTVDELINSKILPRILFSKNESSLQNAFNNFVNRLPENSNAKKKAEKMKNGKRVVQFWR